MHTPEQRDPGREHLGRDRDDHPRKTRWRRCASVCATPPGPEAWRSLEELARTPEMQAALRRELALQPQADGYDRRSFLQLMGASLALAGLAGCTRQPLEQIVPYVKQPEEIVPAGRCISRLR
jgi:molybdopterin-containing oxidoreductase family iron-sulfur binding subunit